MFLLDTCTLIWFVSQKPELSDNARKTIQDNQNELFVSAATALEIGIKSRTGKLKFAMEAADWYREAIEYFNIHEISIDSEISFRAAGLEPIHNNPFDRIIIATAQINHLRVITCDEKIMRYKGIKVIW